MRWEVEGEGQGMIQATPLLWLEQLDGWGAGRGGEECEFCVGTKRPV